MQQGQLGQALGIGLGKNFVDPQQMVQRGMLQQALEQAKTQIRQPGQTPLDKIFSVMQAGAGIPGSERYLGSILPLVQQLSMAEASQNAPLGLENETPVPQQLTDFLSPPQINQQENSFYPNNQGQQKPPGNAPQAATTGNKVPVLSNQQLLQYSKPYANQRTKAGIPTTPQEAYEQLKSINEDNKNANALVETERKERVASQREYGRIAEEKLRRVMPDAGDEEVAYIKRKAEEAAGQNASEADIERHAAAEARKYKNLVSKVEKDLGAIRSYSRPFHELMGNAKTAEQTENDLRIKVQPLLDAGLYDKARLLLSKNGLYPEERERVVSSLGEIAKTNLAQFPKIKYNEYNTPFSNKRQYDPQDIDKFKESLGDILERDPSTNLILLRGAFEDKNVDWRLFKDTLNEFQENGTFLPNDDQFNQMGTLDEPPLTFLGKILHNIGFIGR